MPRVKPDTLEKLALKYSKYIVQRHCTIIEAASHFNIPKSTLWNRLERLSPAERAPSRQVARENIHNQKRRKKNVSRNRRRR